MHNTLYFDYAATTPLDSRVFEKMQECFFLEGRFASAASTHRLGLAAKTLIDDSRQSVADTIGALPSEIIWTSGATESNNLALKGIAELYQQKGKHIVTCKSEHPSVLMPCQYLEKKGFSVTYLTPSPNGLIDLDVLKAALRHDTILVSIMHVNNEIGVIQDIQSIGNITAEKGILLHVDAVQSIGKILCNVQDIPIDALSMCAHKLYGPKGIGALYLRKKPRVKVAPQIHGGGQEYGVRSGTLATHQIVGMAEAFRIAKSERLQDFQKISHLQQRFLEAVLKIPDSYVNGEQTVPHIINVGFLGVTAKDLMKTLPQLAISAGSACGAQGDEPSYVLRALGQSREQAASAIRVSIGRFTTTAEIDEAIRLLSRAVNTLR